MTSERSELLSRRALMGSSIGAVMAAVAMAFGHPMRTTATADRIRYVNDEDDETVLEVVSGNEDGAGGQGTAIAGESIGGPGVVGVSASNIGVFGQSDASSGVSGVSTEGSGVSGYSTTQAGVVGGSDAGRGGEFSGQVAQLRLVPPGPPSDGEIGAGRRRHPASGLTGDLFCEANGRLWFCRGGEDWVRLA